MNAILLNLILLIKKVKQLNFKLPRIIYLSLFFKDHFISPLLMINRFFTGIVMIN